jgi:hypothetical protein
MFSTRRPRTRQKYLGPKNPEGLRRGPSLSCFQTSSPRWSADETTSPVLDLGRGRVKKASCGPTRPTSCQSHPSAIPFSRPRATPLTEPVLADGEWRAGGYARFLKRQLSLPVSMMSQWCVSRSGMAVVILTSPNRAECYNSWPRRVSSHDHRPPSFPFIRHRLSVVPERSARGSAYVVVALPDGRRRSVRIASTNLAEEPSRREGDSVPRPAPCVAMQITAMDRARETARSPTRSPPAKTFPRRSDWSEPLASSNNGKSRGALVRDGGADPFSGALYVFRSKRAQHATFCIQSSKCDNCISVASPFWTKAPSRTVPTRQGFEVHLHGGAAWV